MCGKRGVGVKVLRHGKTQIQARFPAHLPLNAKIEEIKMPDKKGGFSYDLETINSVSVIEIPGGDTGKSGRTPQKGDMMRRILTSLTLLVAMLPTTIQAQTACAERGMVVEKLEGRYGEVFAGGGLQNSSAVFELWFSEEKGTWTILMTRPNGLSCIMASGTNWRDAGPRFKTPAGIKS